MPAHGSNPVGEGLILHRMDEQDKKLDTLVELMTGNGDPSKGLVVRVSGLEKDVGYAKFWSGTSVVAVIGAAATWAWSKMTGGHP